MRKNMCDSAWFLDCSEYGGGLETAPRYVYFNVDEIQNVACAAVGAQRCVMFKKLGEGSYNKLFALNIDNGVEVIARLPTALAGAPFFTTATVLAPDRSLTLKWAVVR
ncbi:hypothetical protein JB92DRAFT_3143876 [Gautieria morchelliformis]|nr:hypothetical protein JB92DRAFT_3143876 [Gautieria morchelliformis]